MKKGSKRYKAWCYSCDSELVAGGKKCSSCGKRMPNKPLNEDVILESPSYSFSIEELLKE